MTLARGDSRRTVDLATDFVVLDDDETDPRKAKVLITDDCEASLEELQDLLEHALFDPCEDDDEDSLDTQRFDFREDAHEAACRLMLDAATAEVEIIRRAVRNHLMPKLPTGMITRIRVVDGAEDVEVELLPDENAEASQGE